MPEIKPCDFCGEPFERGGLDRGNWARKLYCDMPCKWAAVRDRKRTLALAAQVSEARTERNKRTLTAWQDRRRKSVAAQKARQDLIKKGVYA